MNYSMQQLRGLSIEKAELFGKPHIGATYTGTNSYRLMTHNCFMCMKLATNCHHVAPLSLGKVFQLQTSKGTWFLRSPLFALCGSGTTGCHNDFHGGARYVARWVWDDPIYEQEWWNGEMLSRHYPHDKALYLYGRWEILDKTTGRTLTIREGL